MMHRICTLHWVPGCSVHLPGSNSFYNFSVVLHVNVVSWGILAYTLRLDDELGAVHKPALIDESHPYRFWLWQAERQTFYASTELSNVSGHVPRLDYDSFAPFRVIRKLPRAKLDSLAHLLMKAFYDLDASQLCCMYNPIKIPTNLLFKRLDRAINYANEVALRSAK